MSATAEVECDGRRCRKQPTSLAASASPNILRFFKLQCVAIATFSSLFYYHDMALSIRGEAAHQMYTRGSVVGEA